MKAFFIVIFCWSGLGFSQDTLAQINSNQFGFDQTYVLNKDGSFVYWTRCHCTGGSTRGVGRYTEKGRKLHFEFDSLNIPGSAAYCGSPEPADSIELFVYDVLDSTLLADFEAVDSTWHWLNPIQNKVKSNGMPIKVFSVYYESITIQPDQQCAVYHVYLGQKCNTVNQGTVHELKQKKGAFQRLKVYSYGYRERKKSKSIYQFEMKN
jgi:hypothetical protein